MDEGLNLLPVPRSVRREAGTLPLPRKAYIRVAGASASQLRMAASVMQRAVRDACGGVEWSIIAGDGGPADGVAARLRVDPAIGHREGYRLTVGAQGIDIVGADPAGVFYGAQTLAQLLRQFPEALPAVRVEDWPDFAHRGVMLDISRDKVPTMQTLYELIDLLASWKVNQVQLYIEHTFAYRAHPQVWAQASPMTGEQILALDEYCRDRFVELVPNQNSFGHMERWLNLPKYKPLAEAPEGSDTPWGFRWQGPFSLCPTDPRSIELLAGLYDELLPHFTSRSFNVGCDETFDIGQGRSKAAVEARGKERVYLDFLLKVHKLVSERGRQMQFWGDIILHRPQLISELPKDIVAMEWGYEANHPFDKDGKLFREAGVPFYVCPGTSSWCTVAGRTDNALANLRSAADNGLKHGAVGYLNTDWGDQGHWQYLPVSYLGFAMGAAYGWCLAANREVNVADAMDRHAFRDDAGVMGRLAYDLGNVYQAAGKLVGNASILFRILAARIDDKGVVQGVTRQDLDAAEQAIDAAMASLDRARMARPDAALIADEFRNAAVMLRHACRRGRYMLDSQSEDPPALAAEMRSILGEHRRLWLARNREGGLQDSARKLEERLAEYQPSGSKPL